MSELEVVLDFVTVAGDASLPGGCSPSFLPCGDFKEINVEVVMEGR